MVGRFETVGCVFVTLGLTMAGGLAQADVCPDPADPRVHYLEGSHEDPALCTEASPVCRDVEGYPEEPFASPECGCGCKEEDALWRRVKVTEGEPASVRLPVTPVRGSLWEVVSTNRTIGYPDVHPSSGGLPPASSGSAVQLTWQTSDEDGLSRVGTHQVVVHYQRSVAHPAAPARVAYITITVLPAPVAETCGLPEVMAKFYECRAAADMDACVGTGGIWTRAGLAGWEMCLCPTGQGDCPCTNSDQCLAGICSRPLGECTGATDGFCSSQSPSFGCFCVIEDGRGVGLCID
jgi:hypothetical protein